MQQDYDPEDFMSGGPGCPMHGDDAMVACANCGTEFCQRCHPNSQFCPECERSERGEDEDGGDEPLEDTEAAADEEDTEALPEDVKADLEGESADEEERPKLKIRPAMVPPSPKIPHAKVSAPAKPTPSKKPSKAISSRKTKRVPKPATRKPAKTKPALKQKPAKKASPARPSRRPAKMKKPARKSRR